VHCPRLKFRSHRAMSFAANAAPARSPTLQRGVDVHPRHHGREYGRSRLRRLEYEPSMATLVCRRRIRIQRFGLYVRLVPRVGPLGNRPKLRQGSLCVFLNSRPLSVNKRFRTPFSCGHLFPDSITQQRSNRNSRQGFLPAGCSRS
jgi:hypothetical protein